MIQHLKSWVYFALNRETGLVKIGRTTTRKIRLKKLQQQYGDVIFVASVEGDSKKESELHKRFQADRVSGEWFKYSRVISKYVKKLKDKNRDLVCSLVSDGVIHLRDCELGYYSIRRGMQNESDKDFELLRRLYLESNRIFDYCFQGCPRQVLHNYTELGGKSA